MARDFNKQARDDARPPFRNKSSNKFGEERSSRPARPRLNRETVDRAWESGAQTQHHDYRPRTSNGQPPRNGQRNNRYSEHSSAPYNNRTNSDRPYDNRSYGNRADSNRPPYGNRSEGGRPYNNRSEGRSYEDRPYSGRSENNRSYGSRPGGGRPSYGNRYEDNRYEGGRPPYRNNRYEGNRSEDGRPSYGNRYENNRYEGNRSEGGRPGYGNRREYDREDNRGPRSYGAQRNPNYRGNDRTDQPRENRGNYRGNDRGYQPRYGNDHEFRRDEPRPFRAGRRDSFQDEPRQPFARGRYEGDYEGLDENTPPRQAPYFRNNRSRNEDEPVEEPHVTRMPDGHVLKGPRPAQRKNERFWKNIADDTENLVGQVHVHENEDEVEAEEQLLNTLEHLENEVPVEQVAIGDDLDEGEEAAALDEPIALTPKPERKSRARTGTSSEGKTKKPRGIVPKPSQRGFKWPTP